jgi:hypothetical protein
VCDATGMAASLSALQQGLAIHDGSGRRAGDAAAFPQARRDLQTMSCRIEPRTTCHSFAGS